MFVRRRISGPGYKNPTNWYPLGNYQGSVQIGATRQKGQSPRGSWIRRVILGISPESVHWYGDWCATEPLRDRVGWQGLTIMNLSAWPKRILLVSAGADTHMTRGRTLCPNELSIAVCEHARPGGIMFRFDPKLSNNVGGLICTHSQVQWAATMSCTWISYDGKPCEDWNGPTGRWQLRRCPRTRLKSCAWNCLRWSKGTGRLDWWPQSWEYWRHRRGSWAWMMDARCNVSWWLQLDWEKWSEMTGPEWCRLGCRRMEQPYQRREE